MKFITKFILWFFLILGICFSSITFAESIPLIGSDAGKSIQDSSIAIWTGGDWMTQITEKSINLLRSLKYVFMWIFVIFMVYNWVQMILSMGTDDDALSKSKRQIWYGMLGLLFINIPGEIYTAFNKENPGSIGGSTSGASWDNPPTDSAWNLFVDMFSFGYTINDNIIWFLKVLIAIIAISAIIMAAIKIMTAGGEEDKVKEGKSKIAWSVIWLLTVPFIELWRNFAFTGKVEAGKNLFETVANLTLFFAGPVAIIFLTLAWYYFITSAGDEEKIKKAKHIVTNTLIATVILLASYTFLLDLATL